jgi:hypothetical protein
MTGISKAKRERANPVPRYNLMGQPVRKGYRGVVIENGRKVLYPDR